MASLDEFLAALFASLGPVGSLLALLLIFALDAALFPALPEVWIVVTYTYRPEVLDPLLWAALLLGVGIAGDVLGTTFLYLMVRRVLIRGRRMPGWLERGMKRWTTFLVVRDERLILLNRVAPVIPFVGAFIATLGWDYRRSLAYVAVGGLAKYAILLFVVFAIGVAYNPSTARWITLGVVVVVVAVSVLASSLYRRRHGLVSGRSP
jgi:membrane protein YqaA with SNARE-associated domain